jgi:beta-lactamase regulating signal transducer with metallopeptidase domain
VDVLANWLWQGSAVALATSVVLHACPRTSATTRYRAWGLALILVLALPVLPTMIALGQPETVVIDASATASSSLTVSLPRLSWWSAALMVTAWIVWVAGSLLRFGAALVSLQRAKAIATPFPPEREACLHGWMSVRSTGRHATLVVSEEVRSAGVLGLHAPAIAVSPAMLQELSNSELDQILVHEWAHVQRRDDIGRVGQVLVTAVAGLHPAVWWINRRLHVERETACDDWTVNVTGAPKGYAACLTKLAALGNDGWLVPAAWSSSSLTTRVVRLLDRRRNRSTRFTVASLAFAPVLAALAVTAASVQLVVTRPLDLTSLERAVSAMQTAVQAAVPPPIAPQGPTMGTAVDSRTSEPARSSNTVPEAARPDGDSAVRAQHEPSPSALPIVAHVVPANDADRALPSVAPIGINAGIDAASLAGTTAPAPATPGGTVSGKGPTPWGVAADAGVALGDAGIAVGRGSKKGAVATAGFFTRLGKSIARSF